MYKKSIAAAIHLLTASGIILGFWGLLLIVQGEAGAAIRVLAFAAIIDFFDGTLARKAGVKEHLPAIDGGLLDNLVDYVTWVLAPVFWAWSFLGISFLVCVVVLITSLFGFSHSQAKTSDHYFRGFPSYWNFLIFYFFLFNFDTLTSSAVLLLCSGLVFAPVKFVYPSRTKKLQKTTLLLSVPYTFMIFVMLYLLDDTPLWLSLSSLYYPVYYFVISAILTKDT